jgi:hypothetical protein
MVSYYFVPKTISLCNYNFFKIWVLSVYLYRFKIDSHTIKLRISFFSFLRCHSQSRPCWVVAITCFNYFADRFSHFFPLPRHLARTGIIYFNLMQCWNKRHWLLCQACSWYGVFLTFCLASLNHNPLDWCLSSSWDFRHESPHNVKIYWTSVFNCNKSLVVEFF